MPHWVSSEGSQSCRENLNHASATPASCQLPGSTEVHLDPSGIWLASREMTHNTTRCVVQGGRGGHVEEDGTGDLASQNGATTSRNQVTVSDLSVTPTALAVLPKDAEPKEQLALGSLLSHSLSWPYSAKEKWEGLVAQEDSGQGAQTAASPPPGALCPWGVADSKGDGSRVSNAEFQSL